MRLHLFILANQEAILAEWDAFATDFVRATTQLSRAAIRDHAREMLVAIAQDLATSQTDEEQIRKSKGMSPPLPHDAPQTAAQAHALQRARSGFDINEMVSEYRALRASVLRLWAADGSPDAFEPQDTIRFNEAIDQAVTESVTYFSREVERSRNLLLGVLGHDMRNPLNVVTLTARLLSMLDAGAVVSKASARLIASGARLKALVDDLVDFNRTNLGFGIRIATARCDLRQVFNEQLDLLRTIHPECEINLTGSGDVQGQWDANRIHQVLGNLVSNAMSYGEASCPIDVSLVGGETSVTFAVRNTGRPIPPEFIENMFEPLKRGLGVAVSEESSGSNLGLGLFIAKEIVRAHKGDISAASEQNQTTFMVVLPRAVP